MQEDFNLLTEITQFSIFEGSNFKLEDYKFNLYYSYYILFPNKSMPSQNIKEIDFVCFGLILYEIIFDKKCLDVGLVKREIEEYQYESPLIKLIKDCLKIGNYTFNNPLEMKAKFPNIFFEKNSFL